MRSRTLMAFAVIASIAIGACSDDGNPGQHTGSQGGGGAPPDAVSSSNGPGAGGADDPQPVGGGGGSGIGGAGGQGVGGNGVGGAGGGAPACELLTDDVDLTTVSDIAL